MTLVSELIKVYILYHNKIMNIIPLIIYPDENFDNNKEILRPIKYHPIWFLDFNEQDDSEHIDITYNEKVYCARKFKIKSEKSKLKQEFYDETFDTIDIIIVLPKILDLYGLNFLSIVFNSLTDV